ncbi:hypothetical protein K469DRAFT_642268 [Zopfia rhizophila CBS 207.26]|uniref:Heterokaryon incompatibility domain-containing protein n=1 Tax=Zopfia rhizophila CBS 207.26 TaxID=1314779 RepID=A0A6A6DJY5_9PEZI|nr:hypothetical protein K469DRAFT_642268 [Zopfia rhizophila CBS 207.26]
MSSHHDARKLIETIRQEMTLNGAIKQSSIVSVFRNMLHILSEDLYDKSTRFLLELLQNADDNTYNCPTPVLNFTYRPGRLRVDCNEVGFTEENVKAICTIGGSTKKGVSRASRYIGEKGIGFKSVFRVADVVWISSRQYTFKFDRREDLGVIAPIWDEFPETTIPGYTSFFMKLARVYDEDELVEDLVSFDPALLIFLRRVKEINLTVTKRDGSTWATHLSRTDTWNSGSLYIVLSQGKSFSRYLVKKHVVNHHVLEEKRPGCSQSEILLAFPVLTQSTTQSVYAFLPIRDYGFRFLLQADFLLTANREGIDNSSSWNCTLRDATVQAFLESVDHIIAGPLKYHWLQYIPTEEISSFFFPVRKKIIEALSQKPVLESWSSTMSVATALSYVPKQFMDDRGTPLTLNPMTALTYLSAEYPDLEIGVLRQIGVHLLTDYDFLRDLGSMIERDRDTFQAKQGDWHSRLAKVLLPLSVKSDLKSMIRSMRIIPLRDGQWAIAEGNTIFFSTKTQSLHIPDGLPILIVDPLAEDDIHRRNLFQQLGVKNCDVFGICRLIGNIHGEDDFNPKRVPRYQLISHALFLYRASWRAEEGAELWFATKRDQRCRGSQLYIRMDCTTDSPPMRIYDQLETSFDFIHDDYLNISSADKTGWIAWLIKTFKLSAIPRLVSTIPQRPSQCTSSLSQEFRFLFQNCHSRDILWILRDNWRHYSQWLEDDDYHWQNRSAADTVDRSLKATLREELKRQQVKCRNGLFTLCNTVLPTVDRFLSGNAHIPTIVIQDPQGPSWSILSNFGVAVERNALYYIRCLEALQCSQPQKDTLAHIYEQLRICYAHEEEFIRTTFMEKRLIYVSPRVPNAAMGSPWYTTSECIAKALKPEFDYPSCNYFFRCLLMADSSALDTLITKLSFIDRSSTLSDMSQLFCVISSAIKGRKRTGKYGLRKRLLSMHIFPISRNERDDEFDYLANFGEDASWFIADREHLRKSFQGKIPLLAFRTEDLDSMNGLLDLFHVKRRKLSNLVQIHTVPRGLANLHSSYTFFLKERVVFIQALIPKTHPARGPVSDQLTNIQANIAAEILQSYILKFGSTEVTGHAEKGELALSTTNDTLQVFMTEECITAEYPSFDFVELIANHCGIKNPTHRSLLQTALTEDSLRRIQTTFRRQGFHINIYLPDDDDSIRPETRAKRYAGASGDIPTIPSPFKSRKEKPGSTSDIGYGSSDDERTDGIRLATTEDLRPIDKLRPRNNIKSERKQHTRLPFSTLKREDEFSPNDLSLDSAVDDVDQNTQYLGELMLSQYFEKYLGRLYDPILHWTSLLRTRAGHRPFINSEDHASFTLIGKMVSSRITDILATNGYKDAISGQLGTPVYHFEVAVNPDDRSTSFDLRLSQLERMRRYRSDSGELFPTDVVILARISNIYTNLRYEFYVNPWNLYASDHLLLHGDCGFKASFSTRLISKVPSICSPKNDAVSVKQQPESTFRSCHGPFTPGTAFTRIVTGATNPLPNSLGVQNDISLAEEISVAPLHVGSVIMAIPEPGCFQIYSYKELQEGFIRLLHLLPGSNEEALQGIIYHVPFEFAGRYRALSYMWGTVSRSGRLWTSTGILRITPNLKAALQHLRHKTKALILWVDAVCINQDDNKEKAYQIRLLPQVFQRATSIFAFLGNDHGSHRAIETLMQIRAKEALTDWPKCLPPVPTSWSTESVPFPEDPVWDDIKAFFQNSWFRRAWVVQEVVLAASVRIACGKWVVDWNDLLSATETVDREHRGSVNDMSSNIFSWDYFLELARHREWEARQTRWALINLLESFRYLESTLTRDRLFALLGFASDGANPQFEPDYESTLEDVLKKYAAVFIEQGKVLQLLYRAGLESQSSRFPSWLPDWTVPKPSSLYESSTRGKIFSASWISEPQVNYCPGSDEIEVSGFLLDSIEKVSNASNVPEQWYQYFREADSMVNELSRYRKDNSDVKWKVPIAGILYPKTIASGSLDLESSYKVFRRELSSAHKQFSNGGNPEARFEVSSQGLDYTLALQETLLGWRFFTTHRGYAGVGPASTKIGDSVYVFNGGGVPFLLTPSESREGVYRLLGECYVHGLMNGEARSLVPPESLVRMH